MSSWETACVGCGAEWDPPHYQSPLHYEHDIIPLQMYDSSTQTALQGFFGYRRR